MNRLLPRPEPSPPRVRIQRSWPAPLLLLRSIGTAAFGSLVGSLLLASGPAAAQYVPQSPGLCGRGFVYSARVCIPREGPSNTYAPPSPGLCATGYHFSARVCVPHGGGVNAYPPPQPGLCATGYQYSARMCVPRR